MVGGVCALWGAKILGERYGKEKLRERQRAATAMSGDESMIDGRYRNSIRLDEHEF
jgi:hypothetical protein